MPLLPSSRSLVLRATTRLYAPMKPLTLVSMTRVPSTTTPRVPMAIVRMTTTSTSTSSTSPAASTTKAPASTVSASAVAPSSTITPNGAMKRAKPSSAEELLKQRDVPLYDSSYLLPHLTWNVEHVHGVQVTHRPVKKLVDVLAYLTIKTIRFNFDWMSGWSFGRPTAAKALNRVCFLETVAGCPGSIAGTLRHLASLRRMRRDGGWIHTLLEEAENERMHLLAALQLKQPSAGFRAAVFVTQGIFFNFFWMAYLVSPRFCHRLVGYLEEEAVITYTHILEGFDKGYFPEWEGKRAPQLAIDYWRLPENATIRDMFLSIRLDEAHHRDVNHTFGDLKRDELNPFRAGE